MFVRACGRCGRVLVDTDFYVGQRWCKSCLRTASNAALVRRRLRAKGHVLAYLLKHACADCGIGDPVVLEFDHLRDKTRTMTQLAHDGVHPDRLDEEISKCEVVCANCHRRRTLARRPPYEFTDPVCERNIRFVRAALDGARCVDCRLADPDVLDFDHIGAKSGSVKQLAWSGRGLARIELEMMQCEIRCVNCHRRRTAKMRGHYRYVALDRPL